MGVTNDEIDPESEWYKDGSPERCEVSWASRRGLAVSAAHKLRQTWGYKRECLSVEILDAEVRS